MSGSEPDPSAARIFIAVDHTNMMELIDEIETEMAAAAPDVGRVASGLEELVELTRQHFDRESEIMSCLGAEEAEAHRRDHRYLLKALTDVAETIRSGRVAVSAATALDLNTWLMFHIQRFDAELIAANEG